MPSLERREERKGEQRRFVFVSRVSVLCLSLSVSVCSLSFSVCLWFPGCVSVSFSVILLPVCAYRHSLEAPLTSQQREPSERIGGEKKEGAVLAPLRHSTPFFCLSPPLLSSLFLLSVSFLSRWHRVRFQAHRRLCQVCITACDESERTKRERDTQQLTLSYPPLSNSFSAHVFLSLSLSSSPLPLRNEQLIICRKV